MMTTPSQKGGSTTKKQNKKDQNKTEIGKEKTKQWG